MTTPNDGNNGKRWYMHDSAESAQLLKARVKAAISSHANEDTLYLAFNNKPEDEYPGDNNTEQKAAKAKAQRKLWGLIVEQIALASLVTYITTHHDDEGHGAITYIMSCFSAGTNKMKLEANFEELFGMIADGIPPDADADAAVTFLTKMANLRDTLKDTKFEIASPLMSNIMRYMVKKRGKAHAHEVRMCGESFTNDVIDSTTKTAGVLDGILRSVAVAGGEEDKMTRLKALMVETGQCADLNEATVLLTRGSRPPPKLSDKKDKCPHCKVWHPGKWQDCHALALSKGKYPPGWADKDKDMQERLIQRAEIIDPNCRKKYNISVMVAE